MPNASIDYVTSHQGQAHITTQNVIDLLGGISGDISGIKKFPQLYNGLANEIIDSLTIQVKTGAALAGGSFFILEEAYDWLLDAGAVGYSRIDVLYLVMYEDPETNVQTCDFVYQVGEFYPNGTTGTVPSAPTGTTIIATYPFLRMDMTDGSIVEVTEYATDYLSNSSLLSAVQSYSGQVITNKEDIAQMKVDFQAGVDTIYNAEAAVGLSGVPTASTPTALANGVGAIASADRNTTLKVEAYAIPHWNIMTQSYTYTLGLRASVIDKNGNTIQVENETDYSADSRMQAFPATVTKNLKYNYADGIRSV